MPLKRLRPEISEILDIVIPENKWIEYFELLDKDSIPNRKQLHLIVATLCQHLDTLEQLLDK